MPSIQFAQRAADQRCDDDPRVHRHRENLEGIGPAAVVVAIESPHLFRDIALETARPDDQKSKRKEKRGFERHQEVTECHQDGACHDHAVLAEPAVAGIAAQHRHKENEAGVETEHDRRERLRGERPVQALNHGAQCGKAQHMLDMPRLEQFADHVEDQHCLHARERKPFPCLGKGKIGQSPRVAKKASVAGCGRCHQ